MSDWETKYQDLAYVVHQYLLSKPGRISNLKAFLTEHGWVEENVPSEKRWRSPDDPQLLCICSKAAHVVRTKMRRQMAILAGCENKLSAACRAEGVIEPQEIPGR